ncbi:MULTISPECIES: TusE/DsrC/DsvC family sulfur relay protein [unclassified Colwellia]|uniref:TusE/DsrC/DsvC family sulfur relay protein n=1 Tax=unclassified Colwellia TaxID=196834 RepID=UPI0015F5F8CB|nr:MULTISPECIES: TusE/DsrC/DsvC family sulfur relay protein [unclassified Colwellia]MBA6233697.1 TusE/DsrC/DsvC family sulfur relay protein [Colwellia sp. MB02u-7]MBA6237242.1 TusE/DsrC/DsvC family sulfur relay protein [Colwellia sp. MB02u-11]MBA6257236.1 TusE/DsrC/DsvC family sulfur relay protein [Colwellia sp. MB3u-28]MBA6258821.1 TusE/DsrC/DsvC family sulfur relay protein [Colwellia sp. MB3u-41]MBA6300486.1 TusE/DsrC/DsvC family sulfur relay protein [Colwellia sp. MB3u-22]
MSLRFNAQEIATDKQGYLINFKEWHSDLAQLIADKDELLLTEQHWEVIRFVRAFYLTYNTSPAIRALTKAMKAEFGEEKASSRYLYRLFKEGPAKQATKYAGLPKPARCI